MAQGLCTILAELPGRDQLVQQCEVFGLQLNFDVGDHDWSIREFRHIVGIALQLALDPDLLDLEIRRGSLILERATQMGPLITPEAAARVAGFVDRASAEGAERISDNRSLEGLAAHLDPSGFHPPTLMETENPAIEIARDEIFGPVAVLIPFEDEDEAIAIANDVPFGLGAGVWTGNVSRAHRVADRLRCGITWINEYHRVDAASPWGGFGLSGYGRENGWEAVEMFTETKSVWLPLNEGAIDWYDTSSDSRLS